MSLTAWAIFGQKGLGWVHVLLLNWCFCWDTMALGFPASSENPSGGVCGTHCLGHQHDGFGTEVMMAKGGKHHLHQESQCCWSTCKRNSGALPSTWKRSGCLWWSVQAPNPRSIVYHSKPFQRRVSIAGQVDVSRAGGWGPERVAQDL